MSKNFLFHPVTDFQDDDTCTDYFHMRTPFCRLSFSVEVEEEKQRRFAGVFIQVCFV